MIIPWKESINWVGIWVFSLLLVACNDSDVKVVEKEIRDHFSEFLIKQPDVPYIRIFGDTPNKAMIELGRQLFNDPILSRNNDVSCATCHLTNHGFADGIGLSVGSLGVGGPNGFTVGKSFGQGKVNTDRELGDDGYGFRGKHKMFRNTLSTINVAHRVNIDKDDGLLWDGRFGNIFFQVLLPIHTPEELCGSNPLPIDGENIFREGGPLFHKPVKIMHSNFANPHTGLDTGNFNFQAVEIKGIPRIRPNGTLSIPNRNECLAIAVAKINSVPGYRALFKEAFDVEEATDTLIGVALTSFVTTHVSKRTPYDEFVAGKSSLSKEQLLGMGIFLTPTQEKFKVGDKEYNGAGCVSCHTPPQFTDNQFHALGIVSDNQSSLSRPTFTGHNRSGFFHRQRAQRGAIPKCHLPQNILAEANYAPDIGRANASFDDLDCFKFRTPSLRNVVETFPYFHHGTEKGQSRVASTFEERARIALENAIRYHLRGPVDVNVFNATFYGKQFYDYLFQRDQLVPYGILSFPSANLSEEEISYLVEFVATGLWDKDSVKIGDLGNDVSHPRAVISGFSPTITRDNGKQFELPPNGKFQILNEDKDEIKAPMGILSKD